MTSLRRPILATVTAWASCRASHRFRVLVVGGLSWVYQWLQALPGGTFDRMRVN